MIFRRIQQKRILAKLLQQAIRILLIKECKEIQNIEIDIISNSTQIIKGEIQKISINAKNINYKGLLFDKFKLEADNFKIKLKLSNRELSFTNDPMIKFNISLSQNSLKNILFSENWSWISNTISKGILNQKELEDVIIFNNQLLFKSYDKKTNIKIEEQINIKILQGKVYLENKKNNKQINIPIEEKMYIQNFNIEDSLINIYASSTISF
tara:strand:+ start:121 stop:753 length:633 start_codon:yes stop_codon:yes gene_type:complete